MLCHLSLLAPISPRLKLVVFRVLTTPVPAVGNHHRSCLGFCSNRLAIHPFVASSVLISPFHVSRQELTGHSESPTEQCDSPCGGDGVVLVVLIVQRYAVCVQLFNVGLLPTAHTAWMKDIHFTNDDVPKEPSPPISAQHERASVLPTVARNAVHMTRGSTLFKGGNGLDPIHHRSSIYFPDIRPGGRAYRGSDGSTAVIFEPLV